MGTDLLYLRDAELRSFTATVLAVSEGAVVLDRTAFYVTGGSPTTPAGWATPPWSTW